MGTNIINIDFYNQINKLTNDMDTFVKKTLTQSDCLLSYIHKHPYYGYHFDNLEEYALYVKIFVMKDLCYVYKKLGCNIGVFKDEGKILFLYSLKALGSEPSIEIFRELCNAKTEIDVIKELRKTTVDFIKSQHDEILPCSPVDDFVMHKILKEGNMAEMSKRYMILLYQFASVVAKAKGKISEDGSKWLLQLATRI